MTPREELIYRRPKLNRKGVIVARAAMRIGGQDVQPGTILPARRRLGWSERDVGVFYDLGKIDTLTPEELRRLYPKAQRLAPKAA